MGGDQEPRRDPGRHAQLIGETNRTEMQAAREDGPLRGERAVTGSSEIAVQSTPDRTPVEIDQLHPCPLRGDPFDLNRCTDLRTPAGERDQPADRPGEQCDRTMPEASDAAQQ